jgi:hypothetical protein
MSAQLFPARPDPGYSFFMPIFLKKIKYYIGCAIIAWLCCAFATPGFCLEAHSPQPEEALCLPSDTNDEAVQEGAASSSRQESAGSPAAGEDEANLCTATTAEEVDTEEQAFFDRWHGFLARRFSAPAVWFDGFFGDRRFLEEGPAGVFVRWRNGMRWSEDEDLKFRTNFNASVRMPQLKKKLRIVVSRENADDPTAASVGGTVPPLITTATQDEKRTDVGLLYDIFDRVKAKLDFGVTVRLRIPPQPIVKARYRYTIPFSEQMLLRFTEYAFWIDNEGFKETSRLDLEYAISAATLLRFSNSATYVENRVGVDWVSELSLYRQLSPKDAISLDISAWMPTRPEAQWNNFRVGSRYRRNFFRSWLFYEIEPEISWPRNEFRDRTSVSAITFLVEVQFAQF